MNKSNTVRISRGCGRGRLTTNNQNVNYLNPELYTIRPPIVNPESLSRRSPSPTLLRNLAVHTPTRISSIQSSRSSSPPITRTYNKQPTLSPSQILSSLIISNTTQKKKPYFETSRRMKYYNKIEIRKILIEANEKLSKFSLKLKRVVLTPSISKNVSANIIDSQNWDKLYDEDGDIVTDEEKEIEDVEPLNIKFSLEIHSDENEEQSNLRTNCTSLQVLRVIFYL